MGVCAALAARYKKEELTRQGADLRKCGCPHDCEFFSKLCRILRPRIPLHNPVTCLGHTSRNGRVLRPGYNHQNTRNCKDPGEVEADSKPVGENMQPGEVNRQREAGNKQPEDREPALDPK